MRDASSHIPDIRRTAYAIFFVPNYARSSVMFPLASILNVLMRMVLRLMFRASIPGSSGNFFSFGPCGGYRAFLDPWSLPLCLNRSLVWFQGLSARSRSRVSITRYRFRFVKRFSKENQASCSCLVLALHDHDRIHDLETDLQFALDEKVREACAVGRAFLVLAVTLHSLA